MKPVKRISPISVVDQVYESIKSNIEEGIWKQGDMLPSENELASGYGVNRLSVRMALQKLSTLGLIETRSGEGSFVKENFSLKPYFSEIAFIYSSKEKYHDVRQVRKLIEGESLRIVAQSATDDALAKIKGKLDAYNEAMFRYSENLDNRDYLEALVDTDFAFHYEIVKASGNSLFKDIIAMLQQLMREHITVLVSARIRGFVEKGLDLTEIDLHNRMYKCILARDLQQVDPLIDWMLQINRIEGIDEPAT